MRRRGRRRLPPRGRPVQGQTEEPGRGEQVPVGRGRVPQEVQPRRGRRLLPLGRHPPVRRRQAQPGREALEGDRRDIRERKRRHG